jgi:putative transposase
VFTFLNGCGNFNSMSIKHLKTLSVRVKDKHAKLLRQMAVECNQVWNLANEISYEAWYVPVPEVGYIQGEWLSAFDIQKATAGLNRERGYLIGAATVQEVIAVHGKSRRQFKTSKLRWRVSSGKRRSLGWVPFKSGGAKWVNGQVRYAGHFFKVWDSYGLSKYQFRAGSFSEDARGRWYFNVTVEVEAQSSTGTEAIGIDLGLKDTATCSDGTRLEKQARYRALEQQLGIAQRARNKQRVRATHAKIKNRRRDDNHKFTTALVKKHGTIFVGNVSSAKLAKTRMAKSIHDAGWHQLKTYLRYKSEAHGVWFEEIDEAYTTQACSCCGALPSSSPKGRAGLGIREWTCCACGTTHDRDINAAKNILALGHERLAGGIAVASGR